MTAIIVQGMTCAHCQAAVETALRALPEVREVQVDLASGRTEIEGEAPLASLLAAVHALGYTAEPA